MTKRIRLAVVLSVFLGVLGAAGESSAYTQSYVTYWRTTPVGGGTYEYKYWVVNTGEVSWTQIDSTTWRVERPFIWDYEIPILTEAAYNSIVPGSLLQPPGWTYEFLDPGSNPGIWTNNTGDTAFDNPYRVLHWYADPRDNNPKSYGALWGFFRMGRS